MPSKIIRIALLLTCLLIGIASASKFDELARRKGFGPNARKRTSSRPAAVEKRATKFQFLTNAARPYQVTSLPDVPFDVGELYAGNIPINSKDPSRQLYFVFQPTVGAPVDEITIWLNGGPGCSSLEGFFQENGRFIWSWGMYNPEINPYSWVNLTNVLWVEQPVGTGFSFGNVTATSEEDIAADFLGFFENFLNVFGIKNFKIYVTGESYAGRFVSYISAAMLNTKNKELFDLSGALMYDPCIGSHIYTGQVATVPFVVQNNNMIGLNASYIAELEQLDKTCGYSGFREQYLTFPPSGVQPPKFFDYETEEACDVVDLAGNAAYKPNPCFNSYEITTQCPIPSDPLGFPTNILYSYPDLPVYFDRADVKKAMHAPAHIEWQECSYPTFIGGGGSGGPESAGDLSPDPIQHVLPQVIQATNRVLIGNGALDLVVMTNGTLLAIQNMTWNGQLGFQSQPSTPIVITLPDLQYEPAWAYNGYPNIEDPQGTMGVQHYERGLMFVETYLSGHMQPQFQPRSSYRHLQWLLGHIQTL